MRAWEKAAKRLTETGTGNRPDITATMNGDRAHGIEPIVANCPWSTVNRYAAVRAVYYLKAYRTDIYIYIIYICSTF